MPLTDTAIKALRSKNKDFKVADGGGLYLLVTAKGSRLWRLKYRFAKLEKVLSIGSYPSVTLAMARAKREDAKLLLAQDIDPSEAKREARREIEEATGNTFRLIAEEYLNKIRREGRSPRTMTKLEWLLSLVLADIGDKPIRDINAPAILETLRKVEVRGRHETALRVRSTIGTVFRYAIATARADTDPTQALIGALTTPKVKHMAAIIEPKKLGGLLRAIYDSDIQPATRAALQLMAILAPRPGELRVAAWTEFDLDKAVWTIPADHTKMRREHRTHLPPQAVYILRKLNLITGNGQLVFASTRSGSIPLSENTMNAALRRLGFTKDEMTSHGFRATASTLLNESRKWSQDAIERQLSHLDKNDVRRAYARGEHWEERVQMLDWWADFLDQLRLDHP